MIYSIAGKIAIFSIYTVTSSLGLYYIKSSQLTLSWRFLIGFLFYGAGFVIWMIILRFFSLSSAYPIAASLVIVATQLIGFGLLNERMTVSKLVGVTLIIIGISVIFLMNDVVKA